MLDQDGSNVTVWREALYTYARANYGLVGQEFGKGKKLIRVKPTLAALEADYGELNEAGLQTMLQQEIAQYIKLGRKDKNEEASIFAIVEQTVSDEGLSRVKLLKDYNDLFDSQDPDGLLKLVVSEHTLNVHNTSPREAKYVATVRYMRNKQLAQQTDDDYVEKFKLVRANMRTLKCKFDPDEGDDALQFLMNLDPLRHGEFMRDVINRERANVGKGIPDSVDEVVDAARKFIATPKTSAQASSALVYAAQKQLTSSQSKRPCANCDELGHWASSCPLPDRRKEGKAETTVMATETENQQECCGDTEDVHPVFGYNFSMRVITAFRSMQGNSRLFTLDSYATESFTFSEELLQDCKSDETVVHGIHGPQKTGRRGRLFGLGPAIVAPEGGVNGISLPQLEQRFTVTYRQLESYTVAVAHDFDLVFKHVAASGVYSCVFTNAVIKKLKEIESRSYYPSNIMVSTVAERATRHTKREVSRAELARTMMRKLYHPSDVGLVRTINGGVMTNCDVTGKDVIIATDIWGKDVPSLMGKTKDKGPMEDRRMFVPVMERKEQTVYADVFHWRGISFILFIVKPLKLLMIQWLPKQDLKHMIIAVNALGNKLAGRGFKITEIIVDPAKELSGLKGKVRYHINTVDARTHVADAEVEIRTVKERMRCTESRLPYKLPRRCVRFLADGVVGAYNITLRAGETVSPRELFTGIKSDYARDLKFEFGQYVQAHVSPGEFEKRGPKSRTVGAIALCSTGNDRGGWWFMSLRKKGFFNALRATTLPMPDIVIDVLDRLHTRDEKVKQTLMETEISATPTEEDGDGGRHLVGMPEQREPQDPADQGIQGTITNNHLTVEQLEEDDPLPVEDAGSGIDSLNNIMRQPEPESEPVEWQDDREREEEETKLESNDGVVDLDTTERTGPGGNSEPTDTEEVTESAVHVPRRSARIANRNTLKMAGGDAALENRVHIFRVKTKKAFGSDTQTADAVIRIMRLTIKKAMAKNPSATVASVMKEFRQLIDKEVWSVMRKANLTGSQLKSAIRSSMFLKEKYDAAGVFDKLKARLVAGGDGQDKTLFDNLSCPTVAQETVMMVLAIAAAERRKLMTIDITGAYLECDLTKDMEVIMKLDPILTKILHEVDKSAVGMEDSKGVTYVKLNKALYGTVQAALLWYEKLKGVLMTDGFTANPYDACLFNKIVDGKQITVCFHVDDLLVTCECEAVSDQLVEHLESSFTNLTVNRGKQHSYLAMNIVEEEEHISVDMTAYIEKCTEGKVFDRPATSPAREDLFDEPEESAPLGEEDRVSFHSNVAQLLYLCKRTRTESLCAVSHLSSRVSKSTEDDDKKLCRVLNYLYHTKDRKMRLKKGSSVDMEAFIDASFGSHADGRSRSGIALTMCGGIVGAWSAKQKLNTKSSTEAEIVGLSDGLSHVIWMRELLLAQGYSLPPTKVHQDNQGVLSIMREGRSPKHRTKHLNIRHFFARDRERRGDIALQYCPTREMIADVLTKAVNGELFQYLITLF